MLYVPGCIAKICVIICLGCLCRDTARVPSKYTNKSSSALTKLAAIISCISLWPCDLHLFSNRFKNVPPGLGVVHFPTSLTIYLYDMVGCTPHVAAGGFLPASLSLPLGVWVITAIFCNGSRGWGREGNVVVCFPLRCTGQAGDFVYKA